MLIPHHFEMLNDWHRDELLREAELERLARLAPRPRPLLRGSMAALLIAAAARLDATATASLPSHERATLNARV
jgi:hypothetical protein